MDDGETGRRIAYWRERRGMTQQLFADRIGRSKSWVEKGAGFLRQVTNAVALQTARTAEAQTGRAASQASAGIP
jgi:transcriptional regulator with XRE-family HTH domain